MRITDLFVQRVSMGNGYYFLALAFLVAISVASVLLCRKFGQKFAYRYIAIILWANFALHFLKQFLPLNISKWPDGWSDSAFPNYCAVLIALGPFLFHFGGKYGRDYLYYVGLCSGVLVYLAPTGALRTDIDGIEYIFETIRFYLCHWPLVVVALCMVQSGVHKLDYHRIVWIPVGMTMVLLLTTLDQILWGPILQLEGHPHAWIGEDGILNRMNIHAAMSNQSMQFGPQPGIDAIFGWLYPAFIPGLMTFWVDGQQYFTPVLWCFPFLCIATLGLAPFTALPYEYRHLKLDILALKQKRKMKKNERNSS